MAEKRRSRKQIQEEAAARMREGKTPLLELAREYGVSTNTLRAWLRESDARARAQVSAKRVATALSKEKYTTASQRQRLLMHALEQSPATIIVTDAEGRIVYANPKFVETTGYAIKEVIGKNPRILKSGETPPEEYRRLWKTITSGKEWRGIFHNRRKDGSLYWERASISPVFNAEGKIANFMAVKEDITDYMEAETARRRATARFQAVIAALPCALVLIDAEERIMLANALAVEILGSELPVGMRFDGLNLRWLDAAGMALAAGEHPVARVLSGVGGKEVRMRLGIVPPMGGVRWLVTTVRLVDIPETREVAALLIFEREGR